MIPQPYIETPMSVTTVNGRYWQKSVPLCLYACFDAGAQFNDAKLYMCLAAAGWWRAGAGAGRGWAGQQEPATTTRHSLPYSLSLSLSLCPTACEKMKGPVRMSS